MTIFLIVKNVCATARMLFNLLLWLSQFLLDIPFTIIPTANNH